MYLSEFLTQHLRYDFQAIDCDAFCKMCGKRITSGVPQKNVIKKTTFNDYQFLPYKSDVLCSQCSALIGDVQLPGDDQKRRLRSFSFLATKNAFKVLKREEIWEHLLTLPKGPFVFCVTYSNKKHIAFKTSIQHDDRRYSVYTDKGQIDIELDKIEELVELIQAWYTVLPGKEDTKQQPTWFTKGEILSGGKNYKNIAVYGIERYYVENSFLEQYRGTALLNLLVFALNKKNIF